MKLKVINTVAFALLGSSGNRGTLVSAAGRDQDRPSDQGFGHNGNDKLLRGQKDDSHNVDANQIYLSEETPKFPHTSFRLGTGDECHVTTKDGEFSLDFACNSLLMPQTWQKKNTEVGEPDYDLAIVGGGIGAAYLVHRLNESFEANGQPMPKIALFERTDRIGGRLVSAWGAGPLGLAVMPVDDPKVRLPLHEYGGMRVDPFLYPLVFNTAVKMGKALFGDDKCLSVKEARDKGLDISVNHCPGMFVRMDVGKVRFATTNKELGILSSTSYKESTLNSYCEEDISQGNGAPFDKCIQLAVAAKLYHEEKGTDVSTVTFKEGMDQACSDCNSGIEGFCDLCDSFDSHWADAVIACSGYDQPSNKPFGFIIGLVYEVIDVQKTTYLHLLNGGFQRFAQGLMRWGHLSPAAPQFQRTVGSIAVSGADAATLVKKHLENDTFDQTSLMTVPESKTIEIGFTDGTSVTAKSVFMNMLPFDLPMIEGMGDWSGVLEKNLDPGLATKIVLGWNDATKGLPAILGVKSCVEGQCERMIFSGNNDKGWMIRQVWMWDPNTIMIYTVGALSGEGVIYPADTLQTKARDDGMDELMKEIMAQLREVTNEDIEDPDWARIQPWTAGNLAFWKASGDPTTGDMLSRPLGADIPVYYGNSEANSNNSLHGWVEGVLEMVEMNLQSIADYLGLGGKVVEPDRSGGMSSEELRDEGCVNSGVKLEVQ